MAPPETLQGRFLGSPHTRPSLWLGLNSCSPLVTTQLIKLKLGSSFPLHPVAMEWVIGILHLATENVKK